MADGSLLSSATAYIETTIEEIVERIPEWLFPALYWPAFGFVGLLFAVSNGLLMLPGIAAPVALVLCVRRWGLARVPNLVYVAALLSVSFAAFFMNMFYDSLAAENDIAIGPIIGVTAFIVAVAGFFRILKRADDHYRIITNGGRDPHPRAKHRLHMVKLVLATMVMFVLQNMALVLCLLALLRRRRWTAIAAGMACAAAVLLSFSFGGLEFDWLALPLGLHAAWQWIKASNSPYWTTHRYLSSEAYW